MYTGLEIREKSYFILEMGYCKTGEGSDTGTPGVTPPYSLLPLCNYERDLWCYTFKSVFKRVSSTRRHLSLRIIHELIINNLLNYLISHSSSIGLE